MIEEAGEAAMSQRIGIFVATMTGMADLCAEEVQAALVDFGHDASITAMEAAEASALDALDLVIIVSSTYGHGDIPDNGQGFFASLEAHPGLRGKPFAVFGLGDRTYADTFCHAGEKWDALLDARGGTRITALLRHDAADGTLAEDVAADWVRSWAHRLARAA